MNSITTSCSRFLPLNQLSSHCKRLLNSINDDNVSQRERILIEQTLWNEVKKIRAHNDSSVFLYLLGHYHTILYQITKSKIADDVFQYHIMIRLGDLNRYIDRMDVAEYHYCNARNLFPNFGHAYNQLGLLTKPNNCYKCCYYYARAAKSSDKPLITIADSNLRIAVDKYDCGILDTVLNHESSIIQDRLNNKTCDILPITSYDWFYVIIVAIYADNIKPLAKQFLCFINDNFSTQKSTTIHEGVKTVSVYCDRESYILLACLDVLLDWLVLGSQGNVLLLSTTAELRQIKSSVQGLIDSFKPGNGNGIDDYQTSRVSYSCDFSPKTSYRELDPSPYSPELMNSLSRSFTEQPLDSRSYVLSSTPNSFSSSSSLNSFNKTALPHDYVLRGFAPLEPIHRDILFPSKQSPSECLEDIHVGDSSTSDKFVDSNQLNCMALRLKSKLDRMGITAKRQTRNIALESILSNREKNSC